MLKNQGLPTWVRIIPVPPIENNELEDRVPHHRKPFVSPRISFNRRVRDSCSSCKKSFIHELFVRELVTKNTFDFLHFVGPDGNDEEAGHDVKVS